MSENPGALVNTFSYGGKGVVAGTVMGAVQVAYNPPPLNAGSAFQNTTRAMGLHAAQFGAVCALFGLADSVAVSNLGNTNTAHALAGCAAGSIMGVRTRNPMNAIQGCGAFGLLQIVGRVTAGTMDD